MSRCREFVLFFSVMDEGSSLFLARNVANFLPALAGGTTVIEQTSVDEALGVRASVCAIRPVAAGGPKPCLWQQVGDDMGLSIAGLCSS